ncbi:hypothetical protein DPSP01_008717 [Paraphaeosphaeria sporulosa]|uniref:Uncharacterized protein n=1 Tax=Paraphaeosphaeria sporulosa TaxID=1460663 RepID=A0A177C144_9PLEO|nr:uncharacterized protein CC84DRAFT_1190449 [Paraphaeosphaeria sporulosa]OAG00340.1 hypothetical protein CC84DRAFT_1190449 [Paraphaeosphaeria sporulosa]
MEAAPPRQRHGQRHFPPSPPSSPTARRRHKKKGSDDPFLRLGHPANHALTASPPSSPPNEADIADEPLYKRVILTPFLFTSFLVSLFLIDTQNAVARTKNSSLFSFLDPEPYQDPYDSRWGRRGSTPHVKPPDSLNPDQRSGGEKRKRRSWHLHRKIRKIAKLEISDAFEMRGRVMVAMVLILLMALYAAWYAFRWILNMF